jgi:cell division protein ZipA
MDILAMLGISASIILILIGLYMIFLSKPASKPDSLSDSLSDLSSGSSTVDESAHDIEPQLQSRSVTKPELVQTSAVFSANDFITQSIQQHSHLHGRIQPVVDESSADDSNLAHEALSDAESNDAQLPLFFDRTPEDATSEFDQADEQTHNRLDNMLDDLIQAAHFSERPHDLTFDVAQMDDSPATHAEIPVTDFNAVVDTRQLAAWEGESALINEHLAEHTRSEENSILVQAEQIIAIHLLPKNNRPLDGQTVLRLLRKYGLRFGEMDLFHRFEETTGEGVMMFSVLKYTQEGPAGFDLDTMEQESFDGLSFFLALPGIKPLQGFDMMMSTAQRLGQECYAQLLDDDMNLLSEQLKGHYRHQVLDFRPAR